MNTDQIESINRHIAALEKMRVALLTIRDSLPEGVERGLVSSAIRYGESAGSTLTAAVAK